MTEEKDYIGHRQRLKEHFMLGQGKDMADYEFLELLLTYAIPRKDTKPIAKALIKEFGSFAGVVSADKERLMGFSGIKESAITVLAVVREAALRMAWQKLSSGDKPVIADWDSMLDYCRMKMAHKKREEILMIMLDGGMRVIAEEVNQRGTVDCVVVHPAEVARTALKYCAQKVIIVHNHPSGEIKPSKEDLFMTNAIKDTLKGVDVILFDHIVVGENGIFSFKDHGMI